MRHRIAGRKLSRSSSHRKALIRTMVTDLLEHERMITTLPKAKELRSVAEKMITLGKRESLHARRQALAFLRKKSVVHKLFDTLGPRYAEREGGYTRILKLGFRRGDAAEVALVELVEEEVQRKPKRKKKAPAVEAAVVEETSAEAVTEEAAPEEEPVEEAASAAEAEESAAEESAEAVAEAEESAAEATQEAPDEAAEGDEEEKKDESETEPQA